MFNMGHAHKAKCFIFIITFNTEASQLSISLRRKEKLTELGSSLNSTEAQVASKHIL